MMLLFSAGTVIALLGLLWAEREGSVRGKWVAKPLASAGFIAVAVAGGAADSTYGRVLLVGFVLSWIGDVLLIPKDKRAFLAGLGSFLLGHVFFAAAFAVGEDDKHIATVDADGVALAAIQGLHELVTEQQSALRDTLGNLHAESSGIHRQAEAAARELAVAGERLHQLQSRHEETQREVAPLQLEHSTLEQRLADLRAAMAAAQAEHARRQQTVDDLQRVVNRRHQERASLQIALENARRTLTEVQRKRVDCNSRLTNLNERRHSLRTDCETQQHALQSAQDEATAAQQSLQQADTQTRLDEKQAHDLQAKLVQFEQSVAERRKRLEEAERARQTADRAADRLQTRHDLLRRLRDEGAGYASGVRAVLQAGGPGQQKVTLSGILGTVAALVRVPAHLDTAIETALGGALQNVITQQWEDARQAIDFLKQSGRGRATFLPLDRLTVLSAIAAPHKPGILGNAADLVEYDPRIEAAVLQLLNRVWIAQDLNAARVALNAIAGNSRPTVVTLEGEIIRPPG